MKLKNTLNAKLEIANRESFVKTTSAATENDAFEDLDTFHTALTTREWTLTVSP